MDRFMQVLQNFQKPSFKNCMYSKLTYFIYHNLVLFSKKNYKQQAWCLLFYQNYSLALHTVEIFCNSILRNHWT